MFKNPSGCKRKCSIMWKLSKLMLELTRKNCSGANVSLYSSCPRKHCALKNQTGRSYHTRDILSYNAKGCVSRTYMEDQGIPSSLVLWNNGTAPETESNFICRNLTRAPTFRELAGAFSAQQVLWSDL